MKMRLFFMLLLGVAVAFTACQNDASSEGVDGTEQEGDVSNSDVVSNPVSADEPVDTVNVAKITFEEETYDFGEVVDGEVVKHTYNFTNTGKVPLVISNARSTCGCTVPNWPKEPIAPGDGGEITVEFKSKGKARSGNPSKQNKPVTITANTYPKNTVVYITGTVVPDPNAKKDEGNTAAK